MGSDILSVCQNSIYLCHSFTWRWKYVMQQFWSILFNQNTGLAVSSLTVECASSTSSTTSEKEAFIDLLAATKSSFSIKLVTTDGHLGIRKHMREQEKDIIHNQVTNHHWPYFSNINNKASSSIVTRHQVTKCVSCAYAVSIHKFQYHKFSNHLIDYYTRPDRMSGIGQRTLVRRSRSRAGQKVRRSCFHGWSR